MTKAERSVFVFGIYLVATGVTLFAVPNMLLQTIGLAPTTEPWIRVLGIPMGVMGGFHIAAARAHVLPFLHFTVWGRTVAVIGIVLLVSLRLAPPLLLAFSALDGAGAVWTAAALRKAAV